MGPGANNAGNACWERSLCHHKSSRKGGGSSDLLHRNTRAFLLLSCVEDYRKFASFPAKRGSIKAICFLLDNYFPIFKPEFLCSCGICQHGCFQAAFSTSIQWKKITYIVWLVSNLTKLFVVSVIKLVMSCSSTLSYMFSSSV